VPAPVTRPRPAAVIGIVLLVAIFASAFVGIRVAVRAYPPGALALLRFGVASLVLAVALVLLRGRLPLPAARDVPALAASGLFGVTLYHLALNAAERTVTAAVASLFVNTTPIFAAILAAIALRERPGPRVLAGIAIGFAGVAVVSSGESGGIAVDGGAGLVLVAALASAIYYVIEKPYLARYPALDVTAWGFWAGTALLVPFGGQLAGALREAPSSATLAALYLGVFPAAIGYVGWSMVLARMDVARATTLLYLIPPVAALLGWGFLGEGLGPAAALGGAVTLAGVALVNARRDGRSAGPPLAVGRRGSCEDVHWSRSRVPTVTPGSRHDPTPASRRRSSRRIDVVLRGRRRGSPRAPARRLPRVARGRAGR